MVKSSILLACAAAACVSGLESPPSQHKARQDVSIASYGSKPPGYPSKPQHPKPKVNSKKLQSQITKKALEKKSHELENAAYSTPDRNRVFSSPGHVNTINMITKYLDQMSDYYTYELQEFQALFSQASGSLEVAEKDYETTIYQYSPSGDVTAQIIPVANLGCNATDYPSTVSGNIALISRGTCPFGDKSALAKAAGAQAAVIYNNIEGPVTGGTLGPTNPNGPYVPTAGVSQADGLALVEAATAGVVNGLIQVDSLIENRTTYNIIAETIGGDHDNVLALGGHSDSVYAGPGINDDGSGIIGILETAIQLSKWSVKNAIRFCFWSAEEFGLLGSEHYAQNLSKEEADKIKLYLNFDMIASPNYVIALYDGDGSAFGLVGPPGSAEAEEFFTDYFDSVNVPTTETDFNGRSDYGPFLDIGIPAGGIFTGAEDLKTEEEAALFGGQAGVAYDVNYHQAGDNYTNLNFEAFLANTKAIAASVAFYGTSFDTLPSRDNQTVVSPSKRSWERHVESVEHNHPHRRQALRTKHSHAKHDCGAAPKEEL